MKFSAEIFSWISNFEIVFDLFSHVTTDDAKILPEKVRRENANSWPGALIQLSRNLANWGILSPFKILITRPYEVILYNIDRMSIAEQFSSVLGASFCYKLVKIVIQF